MPPVYQSQDCSIDAGSGHDGVGLLSQVESFPAVARLRPFIVKYTEDKSLNTNNLQSFNIFFLPKYLHIAKRVQHSVEGNIFFPSAIKKDMIRSDILGDYLTFHCGLG